MFTRLDVIWYVKSAVIMGFKDQASALCTIIAAVACRHIMKPERARGYIQMVGRLVVCEGGATKGRCYVALAHTHIEHFCFFYRNKVEHSFTQADKKRDYLVLVENVLLVGGKDKATPRQLSNAVKELTDKHKGANSAIYGDLQYIILIATAGNTCQFFASDLHHGAKLVDLGLILQVTRWSCLMAYTFPSSSERDEVHITCHTKFLLHFAWV